MDVIEITRQLGAAIQQDERYKRFAAIRESNENDPELTDLMHRIQLIQLNYQQAGAAAEPDTEQLAALEAEFNDLYGKFMNHEKMLAYEQARVEVDSMMNYLVGILGQCVNGEDPATCEPPAHDHDCGCNCDECSGC